MSIFVLKNNKIEIETENLVIPEFKAIYDRDTSNNKEKAFNELAYVYHMADFKSPYNNMEEDDKKIQVKKDFFSEDWNPDPLIETAILKYELLQETSNMRMLKASRKAKAKIMKYYNDVDLTERDDKGKPVNRITDLSNSLGSVGKMMETDDKLEERVKKEQFRDTKVRGQKDISEYERT